LKVLSSVSKDKQYIEKKEHLLNGTYLNSKMIFDDTFSINDLFLMYGAHTPKKTIADSCLLESSGLVDFKYLSKILTMELASVLPNLLINSIPHCNDASISIVNPGLQYFYTKRLKIGERSSDLMLAMCYYKYLG
jgi:hypothetical protein